MFFPNDNTKTVPSLFKSTVSNVIISSFKNNSFANYIYSHIIYKPYKSIIYSFNSLIGSILQIFVS
jgi:hypothetical protein